MRVENPEAFIQFSVADCAAAGIVAAGRLLRPKVKLKEYPTLTLVPSKGLVPHTGGDAVPHPTAAPVPHEIGTPLQICKLKDCPSVAVTVVVHMGAGVAWQLNGGAYAVRSLTLR